MNIYKYVTRVAFLLIAMIMSVTTIMAQSGGNGYGDFDPSNPGNPGSNGWNAATGEVIIDDFTSGNLNSAIKTVIGSSNTTAVTQIVVSGSINRSDFTVANNYANCTLIDFSRTAGLNYVPSSAYSGNATLCSILLPTSITSIQSSAFKNCTSLTSLTSYTLTPPTVTSNAFDGVNESLVVYVPADAVDAYMNADVWKNFTILPIQSSVHSVTIGMPEGTDMSIYKNMNLQLVNAKSGQKYKYILTDKMSYRFGNLVENTIYNAYILNEKDSIFGKIENITLNTEDVTATFTTLAKPQQVSLSIVTPEGKDVTSETTVTWTDANGNYIGQAYSIAGQKAGTQLKYRVVLPEALAIKYASLNATDYTVAEGNNSIICKLDTIPKIKVSGNVKDAATNLAISSAVVTSSQTFGGKYTRTVSAKTDIKGNYTLEISSVPTSLAIAATDYITQTIPSDSLNIGTTDIAVPDVKLKSISGAVINLGFTYTESKAEGEDAEVQNWYDDYNNADYSIYDKTSQKNISQFSVQYPKIVLLEDVAEGDVLELTASSRKSAFTPVTTSVTINAEQNVDVTFNVVELGGINSSFVNNANATVVGILYNADGKILKNSQYSDGALEFSDLADGNYTLVTMGSSTLFNNVYDLSQFEAAGLTAGTDYVQNNVAVKSGEIVSLSIAEVPVFNDSKLHYTGDNTSFTVNKSSIVAGNYLTLTGHIDFKSEYASEVSDVNLVVDLPESCSFVENSVMVGSSTGSYSLDGSRITIPMANYSDRVRFCIIPTESGDYAPSALVQFSVGGNTISQPIGSANYTAKDLSINVPSVTAKKTIPVSGTAVGACDIDIYDGDVLIGQTKSLANGVWSTTCELNDAYNFSYHNIFAQLTTKVGVNLKTESQSSLYDPNAIEVKTITMINTAHTAQSLDLYDYVTVFDYQNPPSSFSPYWYWPSYPDFTFMVDLTNNDTTVVSDVELFVYTSDGNSTELETKYDGKLDKYVATGKFYSNALPINASASFDILKKTAPDDLNKFMDDATMLEAMREKALGCKDTIDISMILDQDSISTFKIDMPSVGIEGTYTIEVLDYQLAYYKTKTEQFDFEKTEKGYRYILRESTDNGVKLYLIDSGDSVAYAFTFTEGGNSITANSSKAILRAKGSTVGYSQLLKEVWQIFLKGEWISPGNLLRSTIINFFGIGDYFHVPGFKKCFDVMDSNLSEIESMEAKLTEAISEQCTDNTYRLSADKRSEYAKQIANFDKNIGLYYNTFISYTDLYKEKVRTSAVITILTTYASFLIGEGVGIVLKPLVNKGRILTNSKNSKYFKYWISNRNIRTWLESSMGIAFGEVTDRIMGLLDPEEAQFKNCEDEMYLYITEQRNYFNALYHTIYRNIQRDYKKCTPKKKSKTPPSSNNPNIDHVSDPSGYVYEGVSTNRVQGVTATAYYKEEVEDMYGDKHENIVKWDAAEYAQENPLFTDEDGMYAWDVPDGLWQVKFEKEGYETTYSDWLPVPPPQLDINIPMTQNTQPEVKTARAFDDAVTVEFDKYMIPDLLTTDNIIVKADGKAVEGTIALLNEEIKCEGATEKFASKVRFNAAKPFSASEVTLTVSRNVKSYASIAMENDFSQTFTVEHEVQSIECDSAVAVDYGGSKAVTVSVLPASASAGKTLRIKNSSSLILNASATDVVLDAEGKAAITVSGELPGTAALTYTVDGYDISASQIFNVEDKANETVAAPVASIASGSTVAKGTEVTLTTTEKNAKIYYTMDGSCPCENESRILYEKPIVIDADITIKAMTIATDGTESDVVTFVYTIDKESGIKEVSSNQHVNIANILAIYNLNGVKLYTSNTSKLENGIYIILTENDGKQSYVKYVKNR